MSVGRYAKDLRMKRITFDTFSVRRYLDELASTNSLRYVRQLTTAARSAYANGYMCSDDYYRITLAAITAVHVINS